MAMKEWFRQMRPAQLYGTLALTVVFFLAELVVSHVTHALTLLADAYHMLCNVLALTGCIITIKYGSESNESPTTNSSSTHTIHSSVAVISFDQQSKRKSKEVSEDVATRRLRNTFGWARVDVLVMLSSTVFLASLCFSLLIEALQTLAHISHHDSMHHPMPVLWLGAFGLVINGVCYLLIGGYTFHQGSFLHVTDSGDVVLDRVVSGDSVRQGQRRLSRSSQRVHQLPPPPPVKEPVSAPSTGPTQRQGVREMIRDSLGCVLVMICSFLVYWIDNEEVTKFIDPIMSIISSVSLLWLSYPYMKESGLILLQTIPGSIDIESLRADLLRTFPDVVSVHDLHVWQLTAAKVIATCHIIFADPKVYAKITNDVTEFFISQGITQVTVQPEFASKLAITAPSSVDDVSLAACLVKCRDPNCTSRHCCVQHVEEQQSSIHKRWSSAKEIPTSESNVSLKSVKVDKTEFTTSLPTIETISESIIIGDTLKNNIPLVKQEVKTTITEDIQNTITVVDENEGVSFQRSKSLSNVTQIDEDDDESSNVTKSSINISTNKSSEVVLDLENKNLLRSSSVNDLDKLNNNIKPNRIAVSSIELQTFL